MCRLVLQTPLMRVARPHARRLARRARAAAAPSARTVQPQRVTAAWKRDQEQRHGTLEEFLSCAYDPSTSYYVGTRFEYIAVAALHPLGFQLRRCGSAGDEGIDLQGDWSLPDGTVVPVVAQCKCESLPLAPRHVREFAGVLHDLRAGTLGVLVSSSEPSVASQRAIQALAVPVLQLVLPDDGSWALTHVATNAAARRLLPKLQLATQRAPVAWAQAPRAASLSLGSRVPRDHVTQRHWSLFYEGQRLGRIREEDREG